MKTPTASNGLCSALATLPVGGPYEIEAGYVDASGTRYTATSRGASCGMLGMTWGQSNSGGRNSGWTTPTYSSMAFSAQQYPDSPQGGTPLREWASAYNTKIIPQASYATAYVMSQALGIPVGISAVGVASRTLQSLSPGGADWVSFTNAVGYHRGVVEFVVWDQGEADADGASAPTGYSASFRGNLLPGLRTATNNPNLKVFIAPVGRFAASTPPSSPNYPAAQINAQREVLRQQYLDIIANEPLVQFSASKLGCVHSDSYHYSTSNTGYPEMSRRDGFTIAKAFGAAIHDGKGPTVASASRSGAVITLTMAMGGATGLTGPTTLATGTVPTPTLGNALYGFQVSKDGFATTLPISTITISGNSLVITLAADPGAAVSIRSCYGWDYDDTNLIYGTYADTTPIPVFPTMTPVVAA
ncbi:sialate O-acetylesterase [Sphingomonas sp. CARO-RG-8B-R24-01]|uniref:sialate O-acetylesterase n=1 Tax=Sphingomonas sp. CARO-RG-8B-R24-01 TaxID=2914831 RepID=UPI001F56CFFB|nr:sialate O-acetylesterase [Sphingomonas sp. CARO-RG-8B-R24-01]